MNMPPIVSPKEWDAAREELLVKEKGHAGHHVQAARHDRVGVGVTG
jgi:predicted dithiol-disulfide oxidoreductase (DUF899 family)